MKTVRLVVPCRNEARRLAPEAWLAAAQTRPWLSFLFVDDGSTDATRSVLKDLSRRGERISFSSLDENRGKGEAVRTGVRQCVAQGDADLIGFWDADLATPLDELDPLVAAFETRSDLAAAFASRWPHLGARLKRSRSRSLAAFLAKSYIRSFVDAPVWDTQCGAKLFTAATAAELFAEPFLTRWLFDVELLVRLGPARLDAHVLELPVTEWHDVPGSKIGLRAAFGILGELRRLARRAKQLRAQTGFA